jgi:CRISPR-associated protein Cas5/CasD subtype I-E
VTTTVVMRICAPGQSWGVGSHFDNRDTGPVPSKTGIVGLLCNAGGIARDDLTGIARVAAAHMAVRVDNPGRIREEFQTAQGVRSVHGRTSRTVVSPRQYIEDGCFTVFLTYRNDSDAQDIHDWIGDPVRPLYCGRARYLSSAALTSHLIPDPDDIAQTQTAWEACQIHPVISGDQCTIVEDTTDPIWHPGHIEEYLGTPVDFMVDSRKRKLRRTRTHTITVNPVNTPVIDADDRTYDVDFTTGEIVFTD